MKFTNTDKTISIIFSAISILSFFTFTFFHIFNVVGINQPKLFGVTKLSDPFTYVDWFCFIGLAGLLYISFKGIFIRHYKRSLKIFFLISSIIILCFIYVYNPFFYTAPLSFNTIFWIIVHFTGIVLIIIFLMKVLGENSCE
jgi:hypothetical protein